MRLDIWIFFKVKTGFKNSDQRRGNFLRIKQLKLLTIYSELSRYLFAAQICSRTFFVFYHFLERARFSAFSTQLCWMAPRDAGPFCGWKNQNMVADICRISEKFSNIRWSSADVCKNLRKIGNMLHGSLKEVILDNFRNFDQNCRDFNWSSENLHNSGNGIWLIV